MAHRWEVARLRGAGAAVPGDRAADGRLDDDGDAGGALAAPRRGRLPAGARPAEGGDVDRLTIAVPVKGRLREPSVSLLEDAGLGPEQPGERALAFPCRNAPVDVLLVRAADIPEYVQDGVVDCGITGLDLVRERGARRRGAAASSASARAGSRRPCRRSRATSGSRISPGATVATVYPRLDARAAAGRGRARRRHRLGRGRAAARARRRDRRPRLVREHAAHERAALARRALLVARRC